MCHIHAINRMDMAQWPVFLGGLPHFQWLTNVWLQNQNVTPNTVVYSRSIPNCGRPQYGCNTHTPLPGDKSPLQMSATNAASRFNGCNNHPMPTQSLSAPPILHQTFTIPRGFIPGQTPAPNAANRFNGCNNHPMPTQSHSAPPILHQTFTIPRGFIPGETPAPNVVNRFNGFNKKTI